MIKYFKSLFAAWAYLKAHEYWNKFHRPDAYGQICRAVSLESKEKLMPKHLVFKGEIELVLGYIEESRKSFKEAKIIIEKYPEFWNRDSNSDIVNQLKEALEKIEDKNV